MKIELGYNKKNWTELGRIHNFPKIKTNKTKFNGTGIDWKQFLIDNPSLTKTLTKIGDEVFDSKYDINTEMYCQLQLNGDFTKKTNKVYFYITGDSCITITDTLSFFSSGYRTIKEWGVSNWKMIN
jgi:hypothetical protein